MASKYSIETLFKIIDGATSPLQKIDATGSAVSRSLQGSFSAAERRVSAVGIGMKRAFSIGTAFAGAAVSAFAVKGVQNALELGDAMAKVGTIADTSVVSLAELQKGILGVSNKTGIAVGELAEAQYQAISAGIATAESVSFVDTATKAAKGGFTDITTAVDGLTSVLNAYGLEADQATKISDQMLIAQNLGKTTFDEMAKSMGGVIPIASSLGVGTDELFSSIAALTASGVKTPEAMTGMKAAFSNIIKPSSQAAAMAEELGIQFDAAALSAKGLPAFLDDIAEATGGSQEKMAMLFGSVEALNAVTVLTGNGAEAFTNTLNAMGESAGATEKAFMQMASTPAEKMRIGLNKITNAGISLGGAMGPVMLVLGENIDKMATYLNTVNWDSFAEGASKALSFVVGLGKGVWALRVPIIAIAGSIAVYRGAMMAVVVATKAFNAIQAVTTGAQIAYQTVIKGNAAATSALTFATKGAATANAIFSAGLKVINLLFISSPIGWIILGLTALVGVTILVAKNWDKVSAALKVAWEWIKNLGKEIAGSFMVSIEYIKNAFTDGGIIGGIKAIGGTILSYLLAPIQGLLDLISKIPIIGELAAKGSSALADFRYDMSGGAVGRDNDASATVVPPITDGDRAAYSREESVSTSNMNISLDKGLKAEVSGKAPGVTLELANSGAF